MANLFNVKTEALKRVEHLRDVKNAIARMELATITDTEGGMVRVLGTAMIPAVSPKLFYDLIVMSDNTFNNTNQVFSVVIAEDEQAYSRILLTYYGDIAEGFSLKVTLLHDQVENYLG